MFVGRGRESPGRSEAERRGLPSSRPGTEPNPHERAGSPVRLGSSAHRRMGRRRGEANRRGRRACDGGRAGDSRGCTHTWSRDACCWSWRRRGADSNRPYLAARVVGARERIIRIGDRLLAWVRVHLQVGHADIVSDGRGRPSQQPSRIAEQVAPSSIPLEVSDKSAEVKSLAELAAKYGLAPPDEVAGPKSGQAFLDYGRPMILTDSAKRLRQSDGYDELWRELPAE